MTDNQHTDAGESIVWLASYPKSGNTWVRFLLYNYFYGKPRKSADINKKIPDLHTNPDLNHIPTTPHGDIICKTHFRYTPEHPYLRAHCKVIYIIRNPKDVLLSNLNYFKLAGKTPPDSLSFANTFIDHLGVPSWRSAGMGNWLEHATSWLNEAPFPSLQIQYESLKDDTEGNFRKILLFLNESPDETRMRHAIHQSAFSRVQKMERTERQKRQNTDVFSITPASLQRKHLFTNTGASQQTLQYIAPGLDERFDHAFYNAMKVLGYIKEPL